MNVWLPSTLLCCTFASGCASIPSPNPTNSSTIEEIKSAMFAEQFNLAHEIAAKLETNSDGLVIYELSVHGWRPATHYFPKEVIKNYVKEFEVARELFTKSCPGPADSKNTEENNLTIKCWKSTEPAKAAAINSDYARNPKYNQSSYAKSSDDSCNKQPAQAECGPFGEFKIQDSSTGRWVISPGIVGYLNVLRAKFLNQALIKGGELSGREQEVDRLKAIDNERDAEAYRKSPEWASQQVCADIRVIELNEGIVAAEKKRRGL